MTDEFFTTASELKTRGEPFAAVTVVRNESPSSGKTGDKAIFGKNGLLAGWIGGGCVYSIAMKEVSDALEDGKPRFVRVSPHPKSDAPSGVKEYKMTCHSGGTVDLFIEPVMPRPHLIVLGKSVIGRALLRIAKAADFSLTIVNDEATHDAFPDADHWQTQFDLSGMAFDDRTFIVVSTQGDHDEQALEAALSVTCRYVGFVGSRKKRDGVFDYLKKKGISEARLKAVHAPVGLDINGKTPEEVAISILAEIIREYRTQDVSKIQFTATKNEPVAEQTPEESGPKRPQIITNPVCGMPISLGMAKYIVETDGDPIYFCCDGCKNKFDAEPEKYG
ncbi:MAG: YHS domain-containing protein [Haliscomenobacteraceae bacterium CHB4]|nr:YHS domain-containing protein [Haliscomenobacteraceae bacterium CHB4]